MMPHKQKDKMKYAILVTKDEWGTILATQLVELPDSYNGDPYGDDVPVTVGSNQYLSFCDSKEEALEEMEWLDCANDEDEDELHRDFLVSRILLD